MNTEQYCYKCFCYTYIIFQPYDGFKHFCQLIFYLNINSVYVKKIVFQLTSDLVQQTVSKYLFLGTNLFTLLIK